MDPLHKLKKDEIIQYANDLDIELSAQKTIASEARRIAEKHENDAATATRELAEAKQKLNNIKQAIATVAAVRHPLLPIDNYYPGDNPSPEVPGEFLFICHLYLLAGQ